MDRLHGRSEIIGRASARLERACRGDGGLLLLTGEPGIGKSRLAEHLAARAAALGATVAWGRCWEAGGAPAYWPWVQVFRGLRIESDPFASASLDLGGDAEQIRFQAFDGAVRLLKQAAAGQPLVVVLDDLHAADVPSLLLLLLLARELRGTSIVVVGAFRDAEARLSNTLAPLLMKIAREAEVLPLQRLTENEVAAWIAEARPQASAEQAEHLFRVTEGHPLFLVEALRMGSAAEGQRRLVEGLGAVLDEHLAHVPAGARDILQVAAVLGRELALDDLSATAERTLPEVQSALSQAATLGIVDIHGERARFSHVLLRDRLYDQLSPAVRARLHWRAGSIQLGRGEDPQSAVFHLFEGRSAGSAERVGEVALAAAESALRRLAFEDAARLAERGARLLESAGPPGRPACQLRLVAAEAAIRLGESARGKAGCVQAAELARQLGADDLLVRAALVYGAELVSGEVDTTMVALLRQALDRLPPEDSPLRARVTARLAAALSPPRSPEERAEMHSLMLDSTGMARRLGDAHTLLHVLPFAAAAVGFLMPEQERSTLLSETVALARAHDQRLVLLNNLPGYITVLLASGRRTEAEAALLELEALVRDFPQPLPRLRGLVLAALFAAIGGDFDRADELDLQARELAVQASSAPGMRLWLFHRFSLAQLRRDPALMATEAAPLLAAFSTTEATAPFAAWLTCGLGRREEAARALRSVQLQPGNLVALLGAAECSTVLEDVEVAARVHPLLLAVNGDALFSALSPAALLGPNARALGDLEMLLGRPAEAARHYEQAILASQRLGSPWLTEHCRRARDAALSRRASAPAASDPSSGPPAGSRLGLRREGELWALTPLAGPVIRLKPSKGLDYLSYLLDQTGREVHVLELVGRDHQAGDAGPLLDSQAKAQYRQRLDDLKDQLEEAERFSDPARVNRIETEIQAIAEQLAGAVGLGGRDRLAASDVQRARINVQRRLKDAMDRIAAADPALGRYLAAAVKTGTYCSYHPI